MLMEADWLHQKLIYRRADYLGKGNGTIEEELAWHYIMLASRKAHELFESEEDYQKNSQMGFLYWHICCYRRKLTDAELEACYRYDKQFWEHYSKKCRWPIRNVPWGASSVKYS